MECSLNVKISKFHLLNAMYVRIANMFHMRLYFSIFILPQNQNISIIFYWHFIISKIFDSEHGEVIFVFIWPIFYWLQASSLLCFSSFKIAIVIWNVNIYLYLQNTDTHMLELKCYCTWYCIPLQWLYR